MSGYPTRDYIHEGDYVEVESHLPIDFGRVESGLVVTDDEGTLRVAKAPDADPHGPDGLPVNAHWVGIIVWKAGGL